MAFRMNKLAALALVAAVCLFAAMAHAQIDDKPLKGKLGADGMGCG